MPTPIPAATLIVVRDRPDGHEVLMIERHAQLAFAGGAAVFPGGRIDEDDRRIATDAAPPGIDAEDATSRVAAIRESLEEAGIAIGIAGLDPTTAREWRAALHHGAAFSGLLAKAGAVLELGRLTPFARWLPDRVPARVFDTRFYLASAPDDAGDVVEADGGETVRIFWMRPAEMLAMADSGQAHIIFPTRRNLERLAAWPDYAALVRHAGETPVRAITPWIETRDGVDWLTIPEGVGYPVTTERLENVARG